MERHKTGIEYEWNVYYHGGIRTIIDSEYRKLQSLMFLDIWKERPHRCEVTDGPLYSNDARSFYFHHILEKRNYEDFALCKWNIVILTWQVHDAYERNPDTFPVLWTMRSEFIKLIESGEYEYDNDEIWKPGDTTQRSESVLGNRFVKLAIQ